MMSLGADQASRVHLAFYESPTIKFTLFMQKLRPTAAHRIALF
jgi:hypothetical protein